MQDLEVNGTHAFSPLLAVQGLSPPPTDDVIVVGGAADVVGRMLDYEAAGVTEFVLRPIGEGDADVFDQTQRLIEEVIRAVHNRRSRPPGHLAIS